MKIRHSISFFIIIFFNLTCANSYKNNQIEKKVTTDYDSININKNDFCIEFGKKKYLFLFLGVSNYIEVEIKNFCQDSISVMLGNNEMERVLTNTYRVCIYPDANNFFQHTDTISVVLKNYDNPKIVYQQLVLFLYPPPPKTAVFGNKLSGVIYKDSLTNMNLTTSYGEYNFVHTGDYKITITGFDLSTTINGKVVVSHSASFKLTEEQQIILKKLPNNNKFYFENITVIDPFSKTWVLPPMMFRIAE